MFGFVLPVDTTIDSWNAQGMDWDNPDPENIVYYQAILLACAERLHVLQSLNSYYGTGYSLSDSRISFDINSCFHGNFSSSFVHQFFENIVRIYTYHSDTFSLCKFSYEDGLLDYARDSSYAQNNRSHLEPYVKGVPLIYGSVDFLKMLKRLIDEFSYIYIPGKFVKFKASQTSGGIYADEGSFSNFLENLCTEANNARFPELPDATMSPDQGFATRYTIFADKRIDSEGKTHFSGEYYVGNVSFELDTKSLPDDIKLNNIYTRVIVSDPTVYGGFHPLGTHYKKGVNFTRTSSGIVVHPFSDVDFLSVSEEDFSEWDYPRGFWMWWNNSLDFILDFNCEGGFKFRPDN